MVGSSSGSEDNLSALKQRPPSVRPPGPSGAAAAAPPAPGGKAAVHGRLPQGGGEPRTKFGRRAKSALDPVLKPLVKWNWQLASALLTAAAVVWFYLCGALLAQVYPGGEKGEALRPLYSFFRTYIFGSWAAHPLYPSLISTAFTWGMCAFFTLLDLTLPGWARRRRIQDNREAGEFPPLGLWNAIRHQVSLYAYLVPVFTYQYLMEGPSLYGPPWQPSCTEGCNTIPDDPPTVMEFAVHFVVAFVMFDTAYWYWHWMHHHHRTLWIKVHRHHHEYNTPFAFVSQYLHPLEFAATGLFSVVAPVALGAHPLTIWCIIIFHVWLSIEAHTGYDLDLGLQRVPGNIFGGTPHHDEHHRRPTSNFQPFLTYWEHLCGTYYEAGSAAPGAVTQR